MTMNVNIIRIGNSNGVILPARILRKLNLKEKDSLEVSEDGNTIRLCKAETNYETPFSALDRWNEEHGNRLDDLDSVSKYLSEIRSSRKSKEIKTW